MNIKSTTSTKSMTNKEEKKREGDQRKRKERN